MESHLGTLELHIRLHGDLNLDAVQYLDAMLQAQLVYPSLLKLDLQAAQRVNTVGIRFLHGLIRSGIQVQIINPPSLLAETLAILGLDDYLLPLLGLSLTN
jgi:ABC-type transporter Mla MlaB component